MFYIILIIVIIYIIVKLYHVATYDSGKEGEKHISSKLNILSVFSDYTGKVLSNVYIPKTNGGTSEIDVLFITTKGLFVIESKNYAGYIFGNDKNKYWTVTLQGKKTFTGKYKVEKFKFYNPVWQNRTHTKNLIEYLKKDIPTYSIVTFGNKCSFKNIIINSLDVRICHYSELSSEIKTIMNASADVLTSEEVNNIYQLLSPLATDDKETKEAHVQNIKERFNSTDICPVCGGQLVLRTAKQGKSAGNQFLGCSNYPKCKYIKNV